MVSHGSSSLADTLRLIPGYDPFATAEDCWLDEETAHDAIDFFSECLQHIEGAMAGKPFCLEPWEQAFVGNLFGWKCRNDRGETVRRYRESLLFVARKNGKTPLVAGICNYVLFCDKEPGAQIYSAAAEREQAALLYRHAKGMVEREPELLNRARVYAGTGHRSIVLRSDPASSYKVLSADADTKHGGNSHLVVIDELHAQPNRELVDVFTTSMASANRRQPMLIHVTTAGWDRMSVCHEKYEYACRVRDGIFKDKSFLPVIYEVKPEDNWKSPETWAKANPNLGVSVSLEYLERECKRAQEIPAYENTFKRLHLNLWTENETKWLPMDAWRDCGKQTIDLAALLGRRCWGGLDLAKVEDVAAFVLAFGDDDDGITLLPFFWVPKDTAAKRERNGQAPYETWERLGLVETTEGNEIDYRFIRHRINELAKLYDIQEIAFDPWNATQFAQDLREQDGFDVIEFRQSFANFNEPCREFESLIRVGKLRHGNHKVLSWMADSVQVKTDPSGNIRPVKPEHSNHAKVDGIVASIMAVARASLGREGRSMYEDRGLLVL